MVDETWAILKNYINCLEKKTKKKVTLVNNSYILEPIGFWQRSHVVQYFLFLNEKVTMGPIKH